MYVGFELGTGPIFSHDQGLTWTLEDDGLSTNLDENVSAYAIIGKTLFAGAMSGVWRTDDEYLLTALTANDDRTGIRVYPNPAQDYIMVDNPNYSDSGPYSIKVMNSLGQEIIKKEFDSEKIRLDVSSLNKNSLYFLHVNNAQGKTLEVKKIIRN